ncbi:glycosyltransferase [Sinomicrobium oceani]|uniref:glycosyltransferase n=1 Tax=Sinomicrobium oceani TaxID=1150368 RepID=UPI00227B86AF|nr:glycosyltransferase family 2 protein [Sinomicrobium oceani]
MIDVLIFILQILVVSLFFLKGSAILGFFLISRRSKNQKKSVFKNNQLSGKIDIIIAAFNEEKGIINTVNNLLKIDYTEYNILIIDDGSTDKTKNLLEQYFSNNPKIKLLANKKNEGKARALTNALAFSQADIVVFIDADTHVQPNVLKIIYSVFKDQRIAAISGNLKVRNQNNLLTVIQHLEYQATFNFEREVFDKINTLTTIPGAICAFQRIKLQRIGGFNNETLTEDCDVTFKLLREGVRIKNEKQVIGYTEAPESLHMFLRQRIRWNYGLIQNLLKHSTFFKNEKNKNDYKIRLIILYSWGIKIGSTIIFALADYLSIVTLLVGGIKAIHIYYFCYLLVETLIFFIIIKKEINVVKFKMIPFIFYRNLFRHMSFFALIMAIDKFFKKKEFQWKKVKRFN